MLSCYQAMRVKEPSVFVLASTFLKLFRMLYHNRPDQMTCLAAAAPNLVQYPGSSLIVMLCACASRKARLCLQA